MSKRNPTTEPVVAGAGATGAAYALVEQFADGDVVTAITAVVAVIVTVLVRRKVIPTVKVDENVEEYLNQTIAHLLDDEANGAKRSVQ